MHSEIVSFLGQFLAIAPPTGTDRSLRAILCSYFAPAPDFLGGFRTSSTLGTVTV